MFDQPIITNEVRADILMRASLAFSKDDITAAIFHGLKAADIDYRTTPLEEIEGVLVRVL